MFNSFVDFNPGFAPIGEDPKTKTAIDKKRAEATLAWIKENPLEGYDYSKLRYKGPGNVVISGNYRTEKPDDFNKLYFTIPEGGKHNPIGLAQTPEGYEGLPIFQVKDSNGNLQYFVNDKDFMGNYHHWGYAGRGRNKQLVGLYGDQKLLQKLEKGGLIKHLIVNEDDNNSLSLNKNNDMKRTLRKAQEGVETQEGEQGQAQMEQMVVQVQQMLQQAEPAQVIAQLLQQIGDPNAVIQLMSAATQTPPEQMQGAVQQVMQQMQQAQGQEGQQQDPNAQSQEAVEQTMRNGGMVDFDAMRKDMIKSMQKGGVTDANSLDTSSTENYINGLSKALSKVMFTGYAVNKVNKDFGQIAEQFGGLPKADNGLETRKKILDAYGYTQEQYDTDPKIKEEVDATTLGVTGPKRPVTVSSNTNGTNNPDYITSEQLDATLQKHFYPGYGPGMNSNPFGYQQQRFQMSPWGQILNSFSKQQTPYVNTYGDFENKSLQDIVNAIGKTHTFTGFTPAYKENIFGKEKRHIPRNIVGMNWNFTPIGGTNPNATIDNSNLNNNTATTQTNTDVNLNNNSATTIPEWLEKRRELLDAGLNVKQAKAWGDWPAAPDEKGYVEPTGSNPSSMKSADDKWTAAKEKAGLSNIPDDQLTPEQKDLIDSYYEYEKGGIIAKAEGGIQTGVNSYWNVDPSQFAEGIMGLGYQTSGFLDRMNSYVPKEKMLAQRSPDSIFGVRPPHSGDEGIYWENLQRQMGQDMGADVLPGTGTDWRGFNQNMSRSFNNPFMQQQNPYMAFGGTIQKNQEMDLTDEEMEILQSLGYKLKKVQ